VEISERASIAPKERNNRECSGEAQAAFKCDIHSDRVMQQDDSLQQHVTNGHIQTGSVLSNFSPCSHNDKRLDQK
jgi:hypothetical protein